MNAKLFLVQMAQQNEEGTLYRNFFTELNKATNQKAELSDEQQEAVIAATNCVFAFVANSLLPLEVLKIADYINSCK